MKATANALITKTRAMFAKRLKDAEYLYNGLKAFYETKIDIT